MVLRTPTKMEEKKDEKKEEKNDVENESKTNNENIQNQILLAIRDMQKDMNRNNDKMNERIDTQNDKIEKIESERMKEKERMERMEERIAALEGNREKEKRTEKESEKEKETEKKERAAANGMDWNQMRMSQEEIILEEGRKWIGLVPINKAHVRKFAEDKVTDDIKMMNGKDFEEARKIAAEDFLKIELNISDIKILESKLSENTESGILWVKVGNRERLQILSTIARLSIGRQMKIRLLTKIPQQFWARNKQLEYYCSVERKKILTSVLK